MPYELLQHGCVSVIQGPELTVPSWGEEGRGGIHPGRGGEWHGPSKRSGSGKSLGSPPITTHPMPNTTGEAKNGNPPTVANMCGAHTKQEQGAEDREEGKEPDFWGVYWADPQ